ncbi:MAG: hypothetical protein EOP47_20395 [Sphingobacteriaceae bacterium]|nr:MAG: hypothetical protein EOP47_20395 [Sphingobacteriaceae bacterium]
MHIAYSALRNINEDATQTITDKQPQVINDDARLQGYLAACSRYSDEIAMIQQYIPGWVPNPPDSRTGEL